MAKENTASRSDESLSKSSSANMSSKNSIDLEQQQNEQNRVDQKEEKQSAEPQADPNLVTWSGPSDPTNPKNWSMKRKWGATIIVSAFSFISPVSSSMIAPALAQLSKDLGITTMIETQISLSIFVLAFALGPLFLGPLSEIYGRVWVLQLSNLFYFVWNLGCGFAQNKTEMIIFRFLSGIGGSAQLAVGGGVLSDCWSPDQRGKAMGIYTLAPVLGPALGPIAGGFIAETTTWRWVFWATCIADGLVQLAGLFWLPETSAPIILKKKADRLRKETGNENLHTEFESDKTLPKVIGNAIIRPFRMITTQPIIQAVALYMAYLFGLFYLIISTFPGVWQGVYGESVGIGGLNYISLGIGFLSGSQINAHLNDRIYKRLKQRSNGTGRPEYRVPLMFIASLFIPVGLFWYGWSAQAKTHWIVPNIGIAIFGTGGILCLQCMQTYMIDSYSRFAASGLAAAVVLRSIAGFVFPIFAPDMYTALGYGWGNSVLGFAGIVIGIPAPFIFWFYGEALRNKSQYASGS